MAYMNRRVLLPHEAVSCLACWTVETLLKHRDCMQAAFRQGCVRSAYIEHAKLPLCCTSSSQKDTSQPMLCASSYKD